VKAEELFKGANCGFTLARSPRDISLIDIVRAVDGERFLDECVLGFPGCGDATPSPVHSQWKRAKAIIIVMLHKKTLAELSKELGPKLNLIAKLAG
jgi:DNA-binding IscR family transcriptional regulator